MGKCHVSMLSETEMEQIHSASLKILERSGALVRSAEARKMLGKAGAKVVENDMRVFFPESLVKETLKNAAREFILGARNPKHDLKVPSGGFPYLSTDGFPVQIRDSDTLEKRSSTRSDLEKWARLADSLPALDFLWPSAGATDLPSNVQLIGGLRTCYENTEKHIQYQAFSGEEARLEIEMACAVAGGEEELRKRPVLSAVVCTSSPLVLGLTTDAAIEFARAGVPAIVMTMPLVGANSPVTIAGPTVLGNAQVLALMTVLQLDTPGAPVIYSSVPMAMEPQTGLFAAAFPSATMITIAHIQMARHYRLHVFVGGWGGASKIPDQQAAYEKSIMGYSMVLAGSDITSGPGLLENYTILSYEQVMLDHEMYTMMLETLKGMEVSDETMALDVCARVGHEGHFLGQKHTINHFKELWMPKLSDPRPYQAWAKDGMKSVVDVAGDKVKEILAGHKVEQLSKPVQNQISSIIKEGEERIPR